MIDGERKDQVIYCFALAILVLIIIRKVCKWTLHYDLRVQVITKGHRWCYTRMFSRPCYCNVCETLLMVSDGVFCDSCGICADHPKCIAEANKKMTCKPITSLATTHKHHWVKGNLPLNAQCEECKRSCGTEPKLNDFYCCWCQRCVHDQCIDNMAEACDFGKRRDGIVPPDCIRLKSSRIRKQLIREVLRPKIPNWSPVIVIGNKRSGSNECASVLSSFRRILNPAQVVDLSEVRPEEALEWCHLVPPGVRCRVVVAGGDGTVGWILDTIHKLNFEREPLVSILPLGTGNDLSRVLGYGDGHSGDVDVDAYLDELAQAKPAKLDRWKVKLSPYRRLGIRMPAKELYMNNYLSIGVDALVTLNFHRTRESAFFKFRNRIINKIVYFSFGTKDVLEHECQDLDKQLDVYMDNKLIALPSIESIVILNIATWGAGVRPWTLGAGGLKAPKQDYSDGRLEVFGLSSSFHIAQLQIGLSEPIRLGQCSSIMICLKGAAPIQVDGEPWVQRPSIINLTRSHQASILIRE